MQPHTHHLYNNFITIFSCDQIPTMKWSQLLNLSNIFIIIAVNSSYLNIQL